MTGVHLDLVTIALTASYLTLGVFSSDQAERLWQPFALVVFSLTVVSLWLGRRHH